MKVYLGMKDEVEPVDIDRLTDAEAKHVVMVVRRFGLDYMERFPIALLSLSVRAENGLIRQGIKTLGELLRRLDNPRPWPGVGKTSIQEYRRELGRLTK